METIDEYIDAQSEDIRPILIKVRETIRVVVPDAMEKIAWGMPTFSTKRKGGNLIHFAAYKKHIGLYPGDLSLLPFENRLAGYQRSKGAIQFPLNKPIDYDLIADIARWRMQSVEAEIASQNRNLLKASE